MIAIKHHLPITFTHVHVSSMCYYIHTCVCSVKCVYATYMYTVAIHTVDCDFFVVKIFSYIREKLKITFMK